MAVEEATSGISARKDHTELKTRIGSGQYLESFQSRRSYLELLCCPKIETLNHTVIDLYHPDVTPNVPYWEPSPQIKLIRALYLCSRYIYQRLSLMELSPCKSSLHSKERLQSRSCSSFHLPSPRSSTHSKQLTLHQSIQPPHTLPQRAIHTLRIPYRNEMNSPLTPSPNPFPVRQTPNTKRASHSVKSSPSRLPPLRSYNVYSQRYRHRPYPPVHNLHHSPPSRNPRPFLSPAR